MKNTIQELIDQSIAPALAEHNGSAELVKIDIEGENLIVYLEFKGMCSNCPSSQNATLWMIQDFLRNELDMHNLFVKNDVRL